RGTVRPSWKPMRRPMVSRLLLFLILQRRCLMLEKVSQAAEQLATGVSRRAVLSRGPRWLGAAALGVAGLLTPGRAAANPGVTCCLYATFTTPSVFCGVGCVRHGDPCPQIAFGDCINYNEYTAANCHSC